MCLYLGTDYPQSNVHDFRKILIWKETNLGWVNGLVVGIHIQLSAHAWFVILPVIIFKIVLW